MKKLLLLSVCALCGATAVNAQSKATVTPVTIASGYNQDAIAENTTTDDAGYLVSTTKITDYAELQGIDGSGCVYYTSDAGSKGFMCGSDGNFSTTNGITYHVDPAQNNALVLKPTSKGGVITGTLTFDKTYRAKSIYVCGTSADGSTQVNVVVNYSDGTTVSDDITFYNWDSTDDDAVAATVVKDLGRMGSKHFWNGEAGTIDAYGFRIFQSSINTDNTKEIQSVTLTRDSGTSSCVVFAVTVSDEDVSGTLGLNNVTTTQKTGRGYYNIDGTRLSQPRKGVNIIKYDDGTARKVVVR